MADIFVDDLVNGGRSSTSDNLTGIEGVWLQGKRSCLEVPRNLTDLDSIWVKEVCVRTMGKLPPDSNGNSHLTMIPIDNINPTFQVDITSTTCSIQQTAKTSSHGSCCTRGRLWAVLDSNLTGNARHMTESGTRMLQQTKSELGYPMDPSVCMTGLTVIVASFQSTCGSL